MSGPPLLRGRMRRAYNFTKARRNPYPKRLRRRVTLRVDDATISYFKRLAQEVGLPYGSLIHLYLRDCAATERRLRLPWRRKQSRVE